MYESYVAGRRLPIPELPVQYGDFAVWQRQQLDGGELERQLGYWRQQLADAPLLKLPANYDSDADSSHPCGLVEFSLSEIETAALEKFSRQQNVTLFMVVLAAYQIVLSAWTGEKEIIVGTDSAGRNHPALESLIGFFVNLLVIRTKIFPEMLLSNLLEDVRQNALNAFSHSDVPFDQVVQALRPDRGSERNPFFEALISFEYTPAEGVSVPDLEITALPIHGRTAKYPLELFIVRSKNQLRGGFYYDAEMFSEASIQYRSRQLCGILSVMTRALHNSIGEIFAKMTEKQACSGAFQESLDSLYV
jgi:non-ribosomal peptide synthetase component F